MKKQFRKKDYKFRADLGGLCIDLNMDWLVPAGRSYNDVGIDEEYSIAYDTFREYSQRLEVGEYFSMSIFGHKVFAYRNENGLFSR